ncbi:Yos1p [Sporobolomyces koalae]|uniref:Yos1p n=1 Tax=Sporobolomyces koalae TaxID=500713 RepID=UPI00316D2276
MGILFGFGSVAYFALLVINSIAVLSKDRFLAPLGLTTSHFQQQAQQASNQAVDAYGMPLGQMGVGGQGNGEVGVKVRAVQLVDAVRTLMRIPLIPINIAVIVYELLFG